MICPDKNTLMMWIDGELPSGEVDSISDHISQCDSCMGFVSAQKQMESVWRDAWVDPADSIFDMMRNRFRTKVNWWRKQRTWYIAAALCAVYLGVRIFYVDGAGASLSEMAAEETGAAVQICTDEISDIPEETPIEEMICRGCEDQEQEFEILQDESVSDQSGISEIEEELEICLSLSVSGSESAEEEDVLLEGDYAAGHSGMAFSPVTQTMEHIQDNPAAQDNAEAEDVEEKAAGSRGYFRIESEISEESAGFGMVGGTLSGAAGGSGAGDCGTASGSGDTIADEGLNDYSDDSIDAVLSVCPAQTETISETATGASSVRQYEGYSVSLTLESGETIHVQRDAWDSLFMLIDSLQNQNYYSAGESLVFSVSNDGIISGPDVLDDTVIELPETGYGNSAVTVLFY